MKVSKETKLLGKLTKMSNLLVECVSCLNDLIALKELANSKDSTKKPAKKNKK